MLKDRKIKTVLFTQYNVVACLFAVHSTLFSLVCFRTQCRCQDVWSRKDWRSLGRKWCSVLEILSLHLPGGTRESNENLGQDIRCSGRDSNWKNFKIKLYISPAKREKGRLEMSVILSWQHQATKIGLCDNGDDDREFL